MRVPDLWASVARYDQTRAAASGERYARGHRKCPGIEQLPPHPPPACLPWHGCRTGKEIVQVRARAHAMCQRRCTPPGLLPHLEAVRIFSKIGPPPSRDSPPAGSMRHQRTPPGSVESADIENRLPATA